MKQKSSKIRVTRTGRRLCLAALISFGVGLSSCNVVRTVTTSAESYQKGDTTCTIVTKTIESYDATKKM